MKIVVDCVRQLRSTGLHVEVHVAQPARNVSIRPALGRYYALDR